MNEHSHEDRLRDYLLGRFSEPEREGIDELLIQDEKFFERVELAEQELIEAYVNNRLSAAERANFEREQSRRPALRQLVELDSSLKVLAGRESSRTNSVVESISRSKRFVLRPAQIAACFALVGFILAGFLAFRLKEERQSFAVWRKRVETQAPGTQDHPAETLPQDDAKGSPQRADAEQKSAKGNNPRLPIPAFLILPLIRGAEGRSQFQVPAESSNVELRFSIGPDSNYEQYRVLVRSSGRDILNRRGLRSRRAGNYRIVSTTISFDRPGAQLLVATVFGRDKNAEDIALDDYEFLVLK